MSIISIPNIPKPLREKLGEEGTDALVQVLNENEKETRFSVIDSAEQRFEQSLSREIDGLREEMIRSDLNVRNELKSDIADLRGRVEKSKSDTIKWMFLFWVGQIGAVLGIILAVFK
jgi:hypothetical protein